MNRTALSIPVQCVAYLEVGEFLRDSAEFRRGGRTNARALHTAYRAAAAELGLAAHDYAQFCRECGAHIDHVEWFAGAQIWQLKAQPVPGHVLDRLGMISATLSLALCAAGVVVYLLARAIT